MITPAYDWRFEETKRFLMDNSLTFKVGDAVIPLSTAATTGTVTNATGSLAGNYYLLGTIVGFSKVNGEVIGQGIDPSTTPVQVITAANNTTVALYYAVVIPFKKDMTFIMDTSAATGTTTGSNNPNVYFNLTDARTVNEASVVPHNDGTAPLQILSTGIVPGQTTQIYGKVAKSIYSR